MPHKSSTLTDRSQQFLELLLWPFLSKLLSVSYRVILSVLAPFGLFLVTAFVHYMEEEEEEEEEDVSSLHR